jgi:hypothetical protein
MPVVAPLTTKPMHQAYNHYFEVQTPVESERIHGVKRLFDEGAGAEGDLRRPGFAPIATILGVSALALILLGPAPALRPRTELGAERSTLHDPSFAVVLDVRVPLQGRYRPRLRCSSTGTTRALFRIAGFKGAQDLAARVGPGRESISVPLTRRAGKRYSTWLPAGGFRVVVASDDPGARFDALELVPAEGGETLIYEAELGRQRAGAGLMFLSPANSGGASIGSLTAPRQREEYVQTFRAQADGLEGIRLAVRLRSAVGQVHARLTEAAGGGVHFDEAVAIGRLERTGGTATLRFPAIPASAGRSYALRLVIEPGRALQLVAGDPAGVEDGTLRHGEDLLGSAIRFEPMYRSSWPATGYAGLLVAIAALAWGLFGSPRARLLALATLGPALLLAAYALYQRDYRWLHPSHFMPDNYDLFALRFHDLWSGGVRAAEGLLAFAFSYPHAHNPAVPVALSLLLFSGATLQQLYVALSGGAALVAIGLLAALAQRASASTLLPFVLAALGSTHFLFLRAAARTSTDMTGFLLVVAALLLALPLIEQPRPGTGRALMLISVLTLGLFVRLSNLPLAPTLALAAVLWWATERGPRGASESVPASLPARSGWQEILASRRLWTWLAVGVLPLALYFGICFAAGLGPSFLAIRQKGLLFIEARTLTRFLLCMLILVQAFPLLALVRRSRHAAGTGGASLRPATVLGASWMLVSIAFIALSGAPFWNRHFLNVVPALLLVAVPALEALEARHPRVLKVAVALHCVANLTLLAWNLRSELPPELGWAWYVLT